MLHVRLIQILERCLSVVGHPSSHKSKIKPFVLSTLLVECLYIVVNRLPGQGLVVRKPINTNPGLKVTQTCNFS